MPQLRTSTRVNNPKRGKFYKNFYPPANWDKVLELNKHSSMYYAMLIKQVGQQLADYYWNRRCLLNWETEIYDIDVKEINEKVENFLKSRGIYGDN